MKSWLQAWLQPCRFSIEGHIQRHFHPWLLLAILGLCLLVAFITLQTNTRHHQLEQLERQHYQLQHNNEQLKNRLAEAEAELMLRDEQIKQQQQILTRQEQDMAPLRKRLSLLESILLKRRDKGTHILTASAHWQGFRLQLNIVLVKGGNYPREVEGSVEILALQPGGKLVPLHFGKQHEHLTYHMKTHTLLQHTLDWPYDWRPEQLLMILKNSHQREMERITVWVGGKHD